MDKKVAHAHEQSSVVSFPVLIVGIIKLEATGSSIIVIQIMLHASNISVTSTSA